MTTSTVDRLDADGWTFGPIGALMRSEVRSIAFRHGVHLIENKSIFESDFRAVGSLRQIDALREELNRFSERLKEQDHVAFVDAMEKSEKRRAWWGRLIGRRVRRHDLTKDEVGRFASLLASAMISASGDDDAIERLTKSVVRLRRTLRNGSGMAGMDVVASTVASICMRYLQHDLRTKSIRVPDALREQIMAVTPVIDTWEDGD